MTAPPEAPAADATILVTVSSPDFRIGTEVMLHSFLAHNRWFSGEILVLHSRLSEADTAALAHRFPRLSCHRASPRLAAAVDGLVAAHPHLAGRRDRFLSLETLLIPGSRRRLFCDSDMLFRGDIAPLLDRDAPLVACPDAATLRGRRRDGTTMAELGDEGEQDGPTLQSFNAGLMLVDPAGEATIDAMFAALDPDAWSQVMSSHTDQAVWNRLFRGNADLASTRYNLMMLHRLESHAHEPVPVADARVLHFNGPGKPWLPARHAEAIARDPAFAEALRFWALARADCLAGPAW